MKTKRVSFFISNPPLELWFSRLDNYFYILKMTLLTRNKIRNYKIQFSHQQALHLFMSMPNIGK